MNYSKQTFDNLKAVSPGNFKQKSETFIASISKEWETFYKANISELINNLNIIVLVHPEPNVVRSCIFSLKFVIRGLLLPTLHLQFWSGSVLRILQIK